MAISSIATIGSGSINVYFGTASPPTLTDNKTGEEYYVTSDGTIQGTILERWLYSGSSWFKTDQAAAPETVTTLSFDGTNLDYTDENGISNLIDISAIDTSVTAAAYDPATNIMTFTKSDGTTFTTNLSAINQGVADITLDMTGFPNRTDSVLTYNDATQEIVLQPQSPATSFSMYYRGEEIIVTNPVGVIATNTGGGRYIVYNTTTSQLEEFFPSYEGLIKGQLLVAYLYLDGTNTTPVIFADERHSSDRDTQWHLSKHLEQGAVWRDGGVLGYTLNDDTATALSFSTPIEVADEDVVHSITHSATPTVGTYEQILDTAAELPVLYYLGSDFTQLAPTTGPFIGSGQVPKFNQITAGSGALVDAANNSYINYWVIFTNDSRYPVKLMLGQNEYSNLNDAEAENFAGYDLPLPEMVVAYKIITQQSSTHLGNDAGLVIVQVNMLSGPSSTMSQFFTTDSHGNLTGRNLADQHSISAITGLQTVLDTKLESLTVQGLTDTDVVTDPPANKYIIAYDAATGEWITATAPGVLFPKDAAGTTYATIFQNAETATQYPTGGNASSSFLAYWNGSNYSVSSDGGDTWFASSGSGLTGVWSDRLFANDNGYVIANDVNSDVTIGNAITVSSDNGVTFTQQTTTSTTGVTFVDFNTANAAGDYFFSNHVNVSLDGVAWERISGLSYGMWNKSYAVNTARDLYVAVTPGAYATGYTGYLQSWNGDLASGWSTAVTFADTYFSNAVYDPVTDKFFVMGMPGQNWIGTNKTMYSSSDGVTWASHPIVTANAAPLKLIAMGDGKVIIYGNGPYVGLYDCATNTVEEVENPRRIDWILGPRASDGKYWTDLSGTAETYLYVAPATGKVVNEYTISDLYDTSVDGKQDGDALVWDTTSSMWIPGSAGVTVSGNYGNIVTIDSTGSGIEATSKSHVDPNTGFLGINTETPERAIDAMADGSYQASMRMTQFNDAPDGADGQLRKARGTIAAPTAVQDGDEVGTYSWYAYDGAGWDQLANFSGSVVAGTTTNGATITFNTQETDGDGALHARLTIAPQGNVTFNEAFTFPIADGANGQVLITDGAGNVTWQALPSGVTTLAALDDTNVGTPTDGQVLTWDNANSEWVAADTASSSSYYEKVLVIAGGGGSVGFNADYAKVFQVNVGGALSTLTMNPWTIESQSAAANESTAATVTAVFVQDPTNGGYLPTSYRVGSTTITPLWAGGSAPTAGAVGTTDVITFSIIAPNGTESDPATWIVLGQAVNFA